MLLCISLLAAVILIVALLVACKWLKVVSCLS